MKTTHNYTINGQTYKVCFKSGTMDEWAQRLGPERALYFLHTWAAAHAGQSWLKRQAQVAETAPKSVGKPADKRTKVEQKEVEAYESAVSVLEDIELGEEIDLIALMPKEREEQDWKTSLFTRIQKAGGGRTPEGKKIKEEAQAKWTPEEKEEWVEFVMSLS